MGAAPQHYKTMDTDKYNQNMEAAKELWSYFVDDTRSLRKYINGLSRADQFHLVDQREITAELVQLFKGGKQTMKFKQAGPWLFHFSQHTDLVVESYERMYGEDDNYQEKQDLLEPIEDYAYRWSNLLGEHLGKHPELLWTLHPEIEYTQTPLLR